MEASGRVGSQAPLLWSVWYLPTLGWFTSAHALWWHTSPSRPREAEVRHSPPEYGTLYGLPFWYGYPFSSQTFSVVSAFAPTLLKETSVLIVPTFYPFVSKKKVRKWLEIVRTALGAGQEFSNSHLNRSSFVKDL